ncbi:type IV toxin-antitoxin system AbiEi family antitoxin domain-containing protein [Aliidiomarina quisquiliarum]|uniref:type IV toxin-antitoxin system AbiEi family antitoxin domain-containing protein n=1 Tax=Aliidiomarina quisquiliarum TaxID=2938947 RepID=UPI00208E35DF|nr:type IV toxin-antitoxin system AbiEi family antitoxin domain-containing protein [Aliidiomarina quisquiliarum]MCO4320987.1 type IV toxin-antitoxin system AbiEi family antitoxin [Aliidiomarina quisquiliarum]
MLPISENTVLLPFGQLATRQWLLAQGVEVYQIDNALKTKKLEGLARGVVARPGVPVQWQGVMASFNRIFAFPVYVGGASALAQHGLAHYIQLQTILDVYASQPAPSWLDKLSCGVVFRWHRTMQIWDAEKLLAANSLKPIPVHQGSWLLASPEQAYLELLAKVPSVTSFEQADNIMQSLVNLSPRRLDVLLHACKHILAKRLFFFFADRYQHAWRSKLDAKSYNLGAGKRSVVKGGSLNQTYQITVPEVFSG